MHRKVYLREDCFAALDGLANLRRTDSGDFAVLNSLSEISNEVDFCAAGILDGSLSGGALSDWKKTKIKRVDVDGNHLSQSERGACF